MLYKHSKIQILIPKAILHPYCTHALYIALNLKYKRIQQFILMTAYANMWNLSHAPEIGHDDLRSNAPRASHAKPSILLSASKICFTL